MEKDLRREEEDICVRLLLLLLYLSFNSNIQFHKINKINDLTSEMNYMINKKKFTSGDHFLIKSFVVNYSRAKAF